MSLPHHRVLRRSISCHRCFEKCTNEIMGNGLFTLNGNGTGTGTGNGPGNVHIDLRQGQEPGSIVSYCAGPVPCAYADRVPVQCE